MNYMINKIVAIQGNHPSKLNPVTDTSVFLANEKQAKKYKIFYYDPKNFVSFSLDLFKTSLFSKPFLDKFSNKEDQYSKSLPINSVLKPFLGASK